MKIKIERENGSFDEVGFSFRFINITYSEKIVIEKELSISNIESNQIDKDNFVLLVDLFETTAPERIIALIHKLKLKEDNYGVTVSFTTYSDHSGFSFPKFIIDLIRKVGGQIDISNIMIED